jgi:hypothetical protein
MKKLYLLLLTVFSLAAANAQVQFGVKAGANFSNLSVSGDNGSEADTKTKVGFHGGAFVSVPVFSEFTLQPELVFSSQGAKSDMSGNDFTLNSNYLNIPVLLKYNNESGFFAEIGPQLGFLMSAKVKSGGVSADVKSAYQSTDVSGVLGIGYLIKSVNVGIDARYNLGFTNIAKDSGDEKLKNSVFQVGLFYVFGGGAE